MLTQEDLKNKWKEIEDKWDDLEASGQSPYDIWNDWLKANDMIAGCYFEPNWNSTNGIDYALNWLVKMANSEPPVFILDDPQDGGYLAFKRGDK